MQDAPEGYTVYLLAGSAGVLKTTIKRMPDKNVTPYTEYAIIFYLPKNMPRKDGGKDSTRMTQMLWISADSLYPFDPCHPPANVFSAIAHYSVYCLLWHAQADASCHLFTE